MKYLDYINLFWKINDIDVFSPTESKVFFFLLAIANKNGWIQPFYCNDSLAHSMIGVSLNTFKAAREVLVKRKMIEYTPMGGGQKRTCKYQFICQNMTPKVILSNFDTCQSNCQSNCQKLTHNLTPSILNKDIDKDKDNLSLKARAHEECSSIIVEEEPIVQASPLTPLQDIMPYIRLHDQSWIERFCMNNQITMRDFSVITDLFIKELENRNDNNKTIADFQHHFASWFAIHKQKRSNDPRTNNRIQQKQQITADATSSIANNLAELDREYERQQAHLTAQDTLSETDSSDCRLQSLNGEYPFSQETD